MKQQWIGVLDCNNFFVSCERLFRPDLFKKPVVVLSNNDGCVVARSQEIKDMGISMGVPYFRIKDILKEADATTFSSNFALYRDISKRVFEVMRRELDVVEQYSIDEAFFITKEDPHLTGSKLKHAVEKMVGIPVSVGFAYTKTRSKYASRLAKKGCGISILNEAKWTELAPKIPLSEIWGIGKKLELRYRQNGLKTAADLLAADRAQISRIFGVGGTRVQQELQGKMVFQLSDKLMPQQSILSSRSFQSTTTELEVLADAIAYHVRHAAVDLRAMGMKAGAVKVTINPSKYGDFVLHGGSMEAKFVVPTNDTIELLISAQKLLKSIFEFGVPYKKAGIILSDFTPIEDKQGVLFDEYNQVRDHLMEVIDSINKKTNQEVILLGSHLHTKKWQSRVDTCSPHYTTEWTNLILVKAHDKDICT